jgi:sugar phosphate isomerase/epimerase
MPLPLLALALMAADPPPAFARPNLVAWCVVPFDAKKRSPEDRAAMLKRLGFRRYAYDWRAEHLPTFGREVAALKANGIELTAVWFPADLGGDAQKLLAVIRANKLKTQLWVTMADPKGIDQAAKVRATAEVIRPIARAAADHGCTVGLYNHGGWFGDPENQLAVIDALNRADVGIVYNLHHAHDQIDRFPALLAKMKPHLLCLNLNGMDRGGDRVGRKILPLGQGEEDLSLLRAITAIGYDGPVGILGHTMDDAEERLRDNLDGLDWLLPQLTGTAPGPRPKPRTVVPAK